MDFRVFYCSFWGKFYNPTTQKYEREYIWDQSNTPLCKKSVIRYGERPRVDIKLPDLPLVGGGQITTFKDRYLTINAFRHDVVTTEVPYWEGFGVLEGDIHKLTVEEGASSDGNGWVLEPCILLDKKYNDKTITQRWWRISSD